MELRWLNYRLLEFKKLPPFSYEETEAWKSQHVPKGAQLVAEELEASSPSLETQDYSNSASATLCDFKQVI